MIEGLPQNLKSLRNARNLSQREVAKALGISTTIVSDYETGNRTPSTEALISLSSFYNISIDKLLRRTTLETPKVLDVSSLSNKQIKLLNELIKEMSGTSSD